ncbi:unnamed protein product [Adineta steineri]|uniref:Protein sleepless n=1 Tax=Adineta steineri TaxID=433720 RepID=A0A819PIF7_9BILA|nr:unnamed protein product [Adineta steineri]
MNNKILISIAFLLVIAGATARECYKCTACPKPFEGNEAGVSKVTKTISLIGNIESRDDGGADCKPVDKYTFCCKGNLCNGATTGTWSAKLLVAVASLFFVVQYFH